MESQPEFQKNVVGEHRKELIRARLVKCNSRMADKDEKREGLPSKLEEAFRKLGIEVTRFKNEYGLDLERIMRYRIDSKGNYVFLCKEETDEGMRFYVITATPKTGNLTQIAKSYDMRG